MLLWPLLISNPLIWQAALPHTDFFTSLQTGHCFSPLEEQTALQVHFVLHLKNNSFSWSFSCCFSSLCFSFCFFHSRFLLVCLICLELPLTHEHLWHLWLKCSSFLQFFRFHLVYSQQSWYIFQSQAFFVAFLDDFLVFLTHEFPILKITIFVFWFGKFGQWRRGSW